MNGVSFKAGPISSAHSQASADVVRKYIDVYPANVYGTHILSVPAVICFQTPMILKLLVGITTVDKFVFIMHQVRVSTSYNLSWRQVKFTKRIHRI
jgi:hypothetical protein